MWRSSFLIALLAVGTQGYAPIQWSKFPARRFILAPEAHGARSMPAALPQKLTIRSQVGMTPYPAGFTMNLDKTLALDDLGWCIEASGNKDGDAIRINRCDGAPSQKWDVVPSGHGRAMIWLSGSEKCLDVALHKEPDLNDASVELRPCEGKVTESWRISEQTPFVPGGTFQHEEISSYTRYALLSVVVLLVLGALGYTPRLVWFRKTCVDVTVSEEHKGGLSCSGEQCGAFLNMLSTRCTTSQANKAITKSNVGLRTSGVVMSEGRGSGNLFDMIQGSIDRAMQEARVQHILVRTQSDAREIYNSLIEEGVSAESVGRVASQRSTCGSGKKRPETKMPQLRGQPGELIFRRGQMAKQFEKVAFEAPVGELQLPFQTEFGWHVMLVNSRSGE